MNKKLVSASRRGSPDRRSVLNTRSGNTAHEIQKIKIKIEQLASSLMSAMSPPDRLMGSNPFDGLQTAYDQLQAGAAFFVHISPPATSPLSAGVPFAALSLNIASFAVLLAFLGVILAAKVALQGAIIPAVLETAINSDLPGYARAIVSHDVLSFDGKSILIPRGSRVIGQYRNALSLGQSRVFVIWTRVIRPDGVTVQIGSPGDDALGRGGLTGDVDSHFFSRFGAAILLSVLNGGIAAIAGTPTTQISIGSPAAAAGVAATATVPSSGSDILPTIKVKQGAPISIFVARDLDFSDVKPIK